MIRGFNIYTKQQTLCINPLHIVAMWFNKCKILFLGSSGSGKSTIIGRYTKRNTLEGSTIGITVSSATVRNLSNNTHPSPVRFYDMGGKRYWWNWIPEYIEGTDVIFLFYDVTRPETLVEAGEIMDIIKDKRDLFRIILVGNKTDLEAQRKVHIWDIHKFIGRYNGEGWSLRHIECNKKNLTSFKTILDRIVHGMTKIEIPIDLNQTNFNLDQSIKSDGVFDWLLSAF